MQRIQIYGFCFVAFRPELGFNNFFDGQEN